MCSKLEREVRKALQSTGLPWQIVKGKRHNEVYLADRMVLVFSFGSAQGRDLGLLRSAIRRRQEELACL